MKFTKSHEWISVNEDATEGVVGISSYAVKELGDIVYIDLPKIDDELKMGSEAVIIESTKAASDIYSPVSGVITDINLALLQNLSLINSSPEKEGWLFKIRLTNPLELESLLSLSEYGEALPR